jgi:hypothetical protein
VNFTRLFPIIPIDDHSCDCDVDQGEIAVDGFLEAGCDSGDRRPKRTHFEDLIGVENGSTVAVSGSFESIRLTR